mmetsp:Transcript_29580/g.51944  ORF Transcript_29580/g.51944 Transcript_29580/m.51944 type:complete len:328 (+) Transcript_29580:78-1061(+)
MCIGTLFSPFGNSVVRTNAIPANVYQNATPACVLQEIRVVRKPVKRRRKTNRNEKKRNVRSVRKPKRPKTAYNYFQLSEKKRLGARAAGSVHNEEFARLIGQHWKSLSPEKRKKYQEMADLDKQRYEEENLAYLRNMLLPSLSHNNSSSAPAVPSVPKVVPQGPTLPVFSNPPASSPITSPIEVERPSSPPLSDVAITPLWSADSSPISRKRAHDFDEFGEVTPGRRKKAKQEQRGGFNNSNNRNDHVIDVTVPSLSDDDFLKDWNFGMLDDYVVDNKILEFDTKVDQEFTLPQLKPLKSGDFLNLEPSSSLFDSALLDESNSLFAF